MRAGRGRAAASLDTSGKLVNTHLAMVSDRSQAEMEMRRPNPRWTFAIVSIALFMVVLDNLVVTTALPSIRADLGATIQSLEWTVNAYTLSYAMLLLTGAALGDRFGRRRMFVLGLGL